MKHLKTHPTRSIGFLSRLHDGELSEAERREFELHAAECRECAAAAGEFEQILDLYRQAKAEPADPELAARISRRLDARLRWRPPVRYVRLEIDLLWASVVATCLVATLTLYSFRSSRRRPVPVSIVAETKAIESTPGSIAASAPEAVASAGKATPRRRTEPPSVAVVPGGDFAPETPPATPQAAPEATGLAEEEPSNRASPPSPQPAPVTERAPSPGVSTARDDLRTSAPTRPVLIHRAEPIVPEALRRSLRSEGPFTAEAVITEKGDVTSVRILPPVPPGLERPIADALRKWKYKPALLAGRPVSAYLNVVIYVNPN